jgi:hypothetical protein
MNINRYSLTNLNLIVILPQKCGMPTSEKIETTISGSYVATNAIGVVNNNFVYEPCVALS